MLSCFTALSKVSAVSNLMFLSIKIPQCMKELLRLPQMDGGV